MAAMSSMTNIFRGASSPIHSPITSPDLAKYSPQTLKRGPQHQSVAPGGQRPPLAGQEEEDEEDEVLTRSVSLQVGVKST